MGWNAPDLIGIGGYTVTDKGLTASAVMQCACGQPGRPEVKYGYNNMCHECSFRHTVDAIKKLHAVFAGLQRLI